jgi:hypothetical protein
MRPNICLVHLRRNFSVLPLHRSQGTAQRMEESFHSPHRGATRTAGDFLHSSVDRNVGAASKVVTIVNRVAMDAVTREEGGSMVEMNRLRWMPAQPRVARPHRQGIQ